MARRICWVVGEDADMEQEVLELLEILSRGGARTSVDP
jgi:hypothetical protein